MRVWGLLLLSIVFTPLSAAASEYQKAQKVGKPNTQVMGCPDGSFWDAHDGGACWSCGAGKRTANHITSARACLVPPKTSFSPAKRLAANKNRCPSGSFLDIGKGNCWSCPSGTNRTAHPVDSDKACSKRIKKKKRKATFAYKTGSLLKACRKGTFANAGSQSCYTCPDGWKHDPSKRVKTNGVCYQPARTEHFRATEGEDFSLSCKTGFYDLVDGGSCWSCPAGYGRHVTSVKSKNACIAVSKPVSTKATHVKDHAPKVLDIAKGVSKLGCRAHGNGAFFDLKDGGSCWTCPSSHPQRTLYPVDESRACATKTCGKEGGRPCFVWERIPSCNAGLIENPLKNECTQPQNLACSAYVQTLAGFRRSIEEANRLGEAVQEEALSKVPGGKAMINFALNQYSQAQAQLTKLAPRIDTSAMEERFQALMLEDPEFFRNLIRTVRIVAEQRNQLLDFMTDPDQICSGDIDRIVKNLKNQGLNDVFQPTGNTPKSPTLIKMSHLGGAGHPTALAGLSPQHPLLASLGEQIGPLVGRGSRNRLIIDLTLDFPVKKIPEGAVSPGLQIAIPLGDQAEPALYFMLGGYGGFNVGRKDLDDYVKGGLGTVNIGVGLQWGGIARHKDHSCMNSPGISLGGAIKVAGVMGFGFNPACVDGAFPNTFGGFGFNIGGYNRGELEKMLTQVELSTAADGSVIARHKTQKRFQFVQGYAGAKFGPEVSIQLLPLPKKNSRFRIGAPL